MLFLSRETFSPEAQTLFELRMESSRDKTLEAHRALQANPHSYDSMRQLFGSMADFAFAAANARDRDFPISDQNHAFLGFCAAVNIFRSANPGYGAQEMLETRNVLLRGGLTIPEEDLVMNVLRERYQRPGSLRSPESMSPRYERNIGAERIVSILASNTRFFLDAHMLPVDETKWADIAEPLYLAAVAED